ncbi:aminotransferase class I/II-fold pyridoxal phosphate-dependent enzyme [Acinetobacter wanghuae]|uniref:Aminotransferase class I/II-fold pyridoxal phosphate-dependent enzyme n=1 Tax=Acinetobacter wanghuae TaxID=2662362 RepID=A0A5Q0P4X5_9GAMM|nr:PLP-dependent aminotransferase family protein [Acinetobacter wanghuae]MQW92659.1 aminotransferase class I/II-fold pyridoxal phosphate-dependent enzyme [Acinetobacter wanghuae]QGA12215.1 aminotransferase class I/II-fold pyridoxal phosphate-dependent enzyme [Acinetobacter wanghuae]
MGTALQFEYQLLAYSLAEKIRAGELVQGQRLCSIRQLALQHQVSLNTVKSCYALLEAQGWIEAKEKIGYFVKARVAQPELALPQHPDFQASARQVSNLELQIQIQNAAIDSRLIQLGSIQLSPNLIPIQALRRSVQRALKHAKPEDFLYSDRQGHLSLRQALSEHWAEDGFFIASSHIYISNGCMPALSVLLQNLTHVDDAVIVPTPNYNGQLQLLALLKRKIIEIPANTQGFDLARLEHAMQQPNAKACLLTANYQNPLGFCLSHEDKEKIAQLAAKYQCVVIEDDIYAECSHEPQRPLPIQYWDQAGYVVYCGSVSKSLSSAYRVGWFCLPERLKYLHPQFMLQNVSVNTPLQLGLTDLIHSRAYRQHLNQLKPILKKQLQDYRIFIHQAFMGVDIRINQPMGGYVLWIQMPESIDSLAMYTFAQQQGINIVPGMLFGEEARYNNCVRFNAGHELSEDICQAIQCLADWVKQQIN